MQERPPGRDRFTLASVDVGFWMKCGPCEPEGKEGWDLIARRIENATRKRSPVVLDDDLGIGVAALMLSVVVDVVRCTRVPGCISL